MACPSTILVILSDCNCQLVIAIESDGKFKRTGNLCWEHTDPQYLFCSMHCSDVFCLSGQQSEQRLFLAAPRDSTAIDHEDITGNSMIMPLAGSISVCETLQTVVNLETLFCPFPDTIPTNDTVGQKTVPMFCTF